MKQEKRERYDNFYMSVAANAAALSHCKRRQVGAVLVYSGNIISFGFNGTPAGMSNDCEDCDGKTHWYTLHAEANAILKCANAVKSTNDSVLYVTCSPCVECAKLILQAGIRKVIYRDAYKCLRGVDFLKQFIHVERLKDTA